MKRFLGDKPVSATTHPATTLSPRWLAKSVSLIAILQPRVGGVATAAVIANTLPGLLGFGVAIAVVHLLAVPLGWAPALIAGLAASLAWNGALVLLRRRRFTPALSRGS